MTEQDKKGIIALASIGNLFAVFTTSAKCNLYAAGDGRIMRVTHDLKTARPWGGASPKARLIETICRWITEIYGKCPTDIRRHIELGVEVD